MEKVKIGGVIYDAIVRHSGNTLSLMFENVRIEDVVSLLDENSVQEIAVLTPSGSVRDIFRNHALTQVSMETIGGVMRVTAVLHAERIARTEVEELRSQVEQLKAQVQALLNLLGNGDE